MKNSPNIIFNKQFNIALFFFLISAFYGWLMRLQHVVDIPYFEYAHFIQAHSHVTFLGWGFLGVSSLIRNLFLPQSLENSTYKLLFYLMVGSLFGLLISFPLQGYHFFSILFLSVFLLTSYVYLAKIYIELRSIKALSSRFVKTGIFYYYVSSLAIWMVAFVTLHYGKNDLYHNTIYFYLHFLYNGFFVLVLFGLLIRYFEKQEKPIDSRYVTKFYQFTNWAVIPAYALSLLWSTMPSYVVGIGFVAVGLQLISVYYLVKMIKSMQWVYENRLIKILAQTVFVSYVLKISLQFLSAFPQVTVVAVQYKSYFVIGYIHLFTLGFMSLFIFLLAYFQVGARLSKTGISLLLLGIIISEFLLFLQGILYYISGYKMSNFAEILMLVSLFMPVGLLIILIRSAFKKVADPI